MQINQWQIHDYITLHSPAKRGSSPFTKIQIISVIYNANMTIDNSKIINVHIFIHKTIINSLIDSYGGGFEMFTEK